MRILASLRRWLRDNIGPYPGDIREENLPLPMELPVMPREIPLKGQQRLREHPGLVLKSTMVVYFQDLLLAEQFGQGSLVRRWLQEARQEWWYVTFEVQQHPDRLVLRAYKSEHATGPVVQPDPFSSWTGRNH